VADPVVVLVDDNDRDRVPSRADIAHVDDNRSRSQPGARTG